MGRDGARSVIQAGRRLGSALPGGAGDSTPRTATSVSRKALPATAVATATRRSGEKGSRSWPETAAVTTKPAIIMSQTVVAAAARRRGSTRFARSARSEVPAAPTPTPIRTKAATASAMPPPTFVAIQVVATAAPTPPVARTPMPPTIQGVRRPETSDP
jgi:hypothetical protein